ncbi:Phosphocarrier protein HPr [bioreactor metagenome]|uniref:Phosphocarrier protein HPr n=1 Tax=bioreactor metagenome TaxID=1076179 RepID=A0A645ILJ8_9ZZZZ|nr:HPr family phosphocarrier protein [Lachnospiraceae bacterium]
MANKTITVKKALDTRQAALFVQTASKFKSNVKISIDEKMVNAKSLMCIISLGIAEGINATISAEGEDAELAVDEVAAVLC